MRLNLNIFFAASTAVGVGNKYLKCSKDQNIESISSASYQANQPIEDRIDISLATNKKDETVLTVLDGHGGWQVAEYAQLRIASMIRNAIASMEKDDTIQKIVRDVFLDLDNSYIQAIKPAFEAGFGSVGRVGACCLTVIMKPDGQVICANAGDCRAVIGMKPSQTSQASSSVGDMLKSSFTAIDLSRDHNAREGHEQTRLMKEHPNEPLSELIQCHDARACYVKGMLQPSRSLGDLYLKRRDFNGQPRSSVNPDQSRGVHVPPPYNPPYITCLPEVGECNIDDRCAFLIMASDGLWDVMSSQEAVDFVGELYKRKPAPVVESKWPWSAKPAPAETSAAQSLVDEALRRVANDWGITTKELRKVPPGQYRRQMHDDISIVVAFFK